VRSQSTEYVIAHPDGEPERTGVLSQVFQPFTRQLLAEAGLAEGMSVLDVGSAGGDVALVAAEFVGHFGSVVGIEPSRDAVDFATRRASARGFVNVRFIEAKLDDDLHFAQQFDALVGRIVLMFQPNPATILRRLARHVSSGGLVFFQEPDMSGAKSVPAVATVEKAASWMREVFRTAGADSELGPKLHATFKEAGLPAPQMTIDGLIEGSEGRAPALLTESIRAMIPAIEQLGLATSAEIGIETLEYRIRAELEAANATMSSPLLVSAWARIPN